MDFCKAYNAQTEAMRGNVIPVEITIYEDRSFTFITKTPPAAELIKKAAGVAKGSGVPQKDKVGKLTKDQVREIATTKLPDLNANDIDAAMIFINGRRYTGTWDESSLADAMLGSLGQRIQSAAFEFVRWGPSSGLLLALATVLALVLSNSPFRTGFQSWWNTTLGIQWGTSRSRCRSSTG